jgi:hypothetical protein
MFEKNIENEISAIKSLFNFDNKIIELESILTNNQLDDFYKIYISSEVIWWIYQEDLKRNASSNFNLDRKEFKKLNQELNVYLYQNTIFNESDFDIILRNAINLKINFLLRPFQTLKWFIYRTDLQKPLSEISLKLNYFSRDDFLINYIRNQLLDNLGKGYNEFFLLNHLNYFDFYPDKNFSIFEFINILNKVKNHYLSNLSLETIINPFIQLIMLFNKNNSSHDFEIPIEAIIINFNDYGYSNLVEHFENLCINQNISTLKTDEIHRIINNYLKQNQEPSIDKIYEDSLDRNHHLVSENEPDNIISDSTDTLTESNKNDDDFELLIQPDRAELIRVAKHVKNELNKIISSNPENIEDNSEINIAANEISKYLKNLSYKSEFEKYLIKPSDLKMCDIDEIIIFSNDINEFTLEYEFKTHTKDQPS